MVHKNQAHDELADSTPKASHQLNKITQSMIGNSWEYCEDYDAGPTSSKELKILSWCTLIMLTYDTTENHTKLDHAWLDTSPNLPSIIWCLNTSQEQPIVQMHSQDDPTMKWKETQTMRMSQYSQKNISATPTLAFVSWTGIQSKVTWNKQ